MTKQNTVKRSWFSRRTIGYTVSLLVCIGAAASILRIGSQVFAESDLTDLDARRGTPKIFLSQTEFDFGQVDPGEELDTEIRIENRGSRRLLVRQLNQDCPECSEDNLIRVSVGPQEEGSMRILFRAPQRPGLIERHFYFSSNDQRLAKFMVTFRASVAGPSTARRE